MTGNCVVTMIARLADGEIGAVSVMMVVRMTPGRWVNVDVAVPQNAQRITLDRCETQERERKRGKNCISILEKFEFFGKRFLRKAWRPGLPLRRRQKMARLQRALPLDRTRKWKQFKNRGCFLPFRFKRADGLSWATVKSGPMGMMPFPFHF